jgi:hypothetical protein
MAVTRTLIVEAHTFGGGWVGDVRSALSRRLHAVAVAQRPYVPAELAVTTECDPELAEPGLTTYDLDDPDDEDPYGMTAWWERD